MERPSRRNHSPEFNAKVPFSAVKGELTLAGLGEQFSVYPNEIQGWNKQLMGRSSTVFETTVYNAANQDQGKQKFYEDSSCEPMNLP